VQINVTAGAFTIEGTTTQNGAGWVFYVPTTAFSASGLSGNLLAREISASGVPTGGEIALAVPAAQSEFAVEGGQSAILTDGSFIVGYQEFNLSSSSSSSSSSPSFETEVLHYSATGTVLGSFLVDAAAVPTALASGGFLLSEAGFGGTASPNAILATYTETGVTPLTTTTVATATAGEEIGVEEFNTSAGIVSGQLTLAQAAGQTSSVDITLPGAASPLVFNAPAANSASTSYYVLPSNIVVAPDGSFYQALTTNTSNIGSGNASAINIYHIVSGAPQLLTTINETSAFNTTSGAEFIALLSNSDLVVEYSGNYQTTGVVGLQQYVELLSPTGTQIGATISLGVSLGDLTPLSNGNLATTIETSTGLFVEQSGFGAAAVPTLTITSAGEATNQAVQTITGTIDAADAGLTVQIYDGATLLGSATSANDGTWSASVTLPTQGANVLTAQATNAGGTGASNPVTYTLSTAAVPTLAITSSGGSTDQATQTIAGTIDAADAGLTVQIYDGATLLGSATPASDGTWSASVTLPTQGANVLTAQATNGSAKPEPAMRSPSPIVPSMRPRR
jgi:hypothetical protein